MKAMVLKAPRDLQFETLQTPKPAKDQVLVRVTHSGICGPTSRSTRAASRFAIP